MKVDPGGFAFGFIAEGIKRLRQRRRRKRRLRELGIPEDGMALDLGTRTSTNTAAGAGFLGTAYVQLIGLLPWPEVVAALTTPQMVVVVTTLIAWGVARISRTPVDPGKL
jgi:hypothetical protein